MYNSKWFKRAWLVICAIVIVSMVGFTFAYGF